MKGILDVGAAGAPSLPGGSGPSGGGSTPNPVDLLPKAAPAPLSGGDWPFYGRDLANSRNGGNNGPSRNELLRRGPVWTFQSTNGDVTGTPVVRPRALVAAAYG